MVEKRLKYNQDFTIRQIGWNRAKAVCPRCNRKFTLGRAGMNGRKTQLCKGCAVTVAHENRLQLAKTEKSCVKHDIKA